MDLTDRIQKYRETIMKLWNEMYVQVINDRGGNTYLEENFCEVEKHLFEALVLFYLPNGYVSEDMIDSHMKHPGRALANFKIEPADKSMHVQINREFHSGYWDYPRNEFKNEEAEIHFIHFFDWESFDCPRKYEYYLGRIAQCKNNPDLTGKEVIIPVAEARIYYESIKSL